MTDLLGKVVRRLMVVCTSLIFLKNSETTANNRTRQLE
jgi:hypothetical protein